MECVAGNCVEATPVECDATTPCATCAGLDCPIMACIDGYCVEVDAD
jgi:hypothetical protein